MGDLEALRSSKKFVPDKGFSGASGGPSRSGPVEFQKDTDDPFGLDAFLHDAKKASKRSNDDDRRKDERFVGSVLIFSLVQLLLFAGTGEGRGREGRTREPVLTTDV